MKHFLHFLIMSLGLALAPAAFGQNQELDFSKEAEYFQAQKQVYQGWLDHSGLGKTLSIHSLVVKPQELKLYLQFSYSHPDSVTSAWDQLKISFEEKSSLSLEQSLFYKLISIMEIEDHEASIQLYDNYTDENFCFKRRIFYYEGNILVETDQCKAKVVNIDFDPSDFQQLREPSDVGLKKKGKLRKLSPDEIRERYPQELVYEKIYAYAQRKFSTRTCKQRNPEIKLLNSKGLLRFKVTDLCLEVLEEGNPRLCQILDKLGYECNWIKRERLIFTFIYEETPEGFNLYTIVDGSYGSGYYEKVKRGGYHNMEVDFDDELEEYVQVFKEDIRRLFSDKNSNPIKP